MLICNSVFVVYESSESGDVVQIVLKSKLSALVASRSRANAVRLVPIYTVRKFVSAKACLWFILNQNLVCLTYLFTSVQAVNCFKQINDTPVCSQFYAQRRQGLKIFAESILRSFRREPNFVCRHAAQINPLYLVTL